MKTKVGWFEFNWKTTVGAWWCKNHKHKLSNYGRCKRCLKLLTEEERNDSQKQL